MDREQATLLSFAAHALRFATDHPYAATGIFGAAIGSAATYKVLTFTSQRSPLSEVLTPKMYEFALTPEDLHHLSIDPTTEIRLEAPNVVVVVTPEKRESLRALPDIVQ